MINKREKHSSLQVGLWLEHSPCVAPSQFFFFFCLFGFLAFMTQCRTQMQSFCFPRLYTSFQTDGSPLSVFMILITTLASWASSRRSTIFPFNTVAYINNSRHLARKYAQIYVRGHYLLREANSFPRAKLEENCELRGADNVQGQISEHIFKAK